MLINSVEILFYLTFFIFQSVIDDIHTLKNLLRYMLEKIHWDPNVVWTDDVLCLDLVESQCMNPVLLGVL